MADNQVFLNTQKTQTNPFLCLTLGRKAVPQSGTDTPSMEDLLFAAQLNKGGIPSYEKWVG